MIEEEIWKDVSEYEGLYQVSNFGRVRSIRIKKDLSTKIKLLKHGLTRGYYCVILSNKGHHKCMKVHRLVAITFIPNLENKPQVNHIDNNPLNNKVNNLEWCTHKENTQHAVSQNRIRFGDNHGRVKLMDKYIPIIKSEYLKGDITQKELAIKYNVSSTTISFIVNGIRAIRQYNK